MGGMMPQELVDKRIKELAEKCKRIANEKGLYVINQEDYKNLNYNQLKNVVALIEKDGEHVCQFQGTTIVFETKNNPNYRKWYHIEWPTLLVTAVLSIIGTTITNQLSNHEQAQELQKITDLVDIQRVRIDSLKNALYFHLGDSLKK